MYEPGPPRWDPTTEIFPGGPHPAAAAHMHAMQAQEEEARRRQIAIEGLAIQRNVNHLLLLR